MNKRTVYWYSAGVVLAAVLLGYGVAVFVVADRLREEGGMARLDMAEQLTIVASLSEVMARGGADAVTDSVIKDCPAAERSRFDALLANLDDGIPRAELQELSRLFDRCASFYARRKAVMVARFEREVELYGQLTERYLRLNAQDSDPSFFTAEWQELARYEREQSTHFDQLVKLQGDIIESLLSGSTLVSPELAGLLKEVQEVQQMQAYNAVKMKEIRNALPTSL